MKIEIKRQKWAFIAMLVLTAIFVFSLYGKVFWSPNSYLFTASGDGVKNYYSWVWHLKNDSSLLEFDGMNYPYGQHFMYTDCHAMLYFVIKPLSLIFPGLLDYSIGILNFFMLLSFFLTPIFLWLIFRILKIQPFLAALGALGISMLAPQVFRLTGHLSLSYSFFIPLTLWLILEAQTSPKSSMKWDVALLFNGLFWFFIHPYLGIMATAFLFSFWIINFLWHLKSELKNGRNYIMLFITTILPVLIFFAFIKLTDNRTGRTDNPSGFFLYNAEPDDFLVPLYPPLRPLIDQVVEVRQQWEAWSYIGLLSIGVLIFLLLRNLKQFIQKRNLTNEKKFIENDNFRLIIWASLLLLIFSFGWPFKLFPDSIDWFPIVKQFRATGRFTWFFFFAVNLFAVVVLSKYWETFENNSKRNLQRAFIIFLISFPFIEGLPYHLDYHRQISQQANVFKLSDCSADFKELLKQVDPDNFQAIIPLPFYYNGSENFSIPVRGDAMLTSTMVSYHTKLPILGGALSRTGIEESRKSIQVISPDFYPKKIERNLQSTKPFLVVKAKGELSSYEIALLHKCKLIYKTYEVSVYKLEADRLFRSSATEEIEKFKLLNNQNPRLGISPYRIDRVYNWKNFMVNDTNAFLYFNEFNDRESQETFGGSGAFSGNKKDHLTVAEFGPGTFKANTTYSISAWFYNGGQDALNFWFRFGKEEYNPVTDVWSESYVLPEQSQVIFGDWSLVELDFQVADPQNEVSFKTLGKTIDKQFFFLDDILIREKRVDVYKILEQKNGRITSLFKNNQRINLD